VLVPLGGAASVTHRANEGERPDERISDVLGADVEQRLHGGSSLAEEGRTEKGEGNTKG